MMPEDVITSLQLQPHPIEGGFFRETYRSSYSVDATQVPGSPGTRSFGTAIYYMLTGKSVSEMHVLPTDEVFHFYLGDPVHMLQLWPDGSIRNVILGNDLTRGHQPQIVVPGGVWQGSFLIEGGKFALMGATMAPGFDYADYTRGIRSHLIDSYPQAAAWIEKLTPNG
jgi:uncharacterized protein